MALALLALAAWEGLVAPAKVLATIRTQAICRV